MKEKEGTALVAVLAFTLLSSIFAAALLASGTSQARVSRSQLNIEKAVFVAEAGAEHAAQYVEEQKGSLPATYVDSGSFGEGSYTHQLDKSAWRTYALKSVGTVNGVSRQVSIDRLYIPTYASYALWMHTNGRIYFIPGEQFFGHVHSNDKLWFSSNQMVAPSSGRNSPRPIARTGGVLDWATFTKGFDMNSAQGQMADIDFNSPSPFSLKTLASSQGLVLEGNTTIEFVDNNMKISNDAMGWTDHVVPIGDDQLVYVADSPSESGTIYLQGGDIDGRVTLVSEDDTRISDHLDYKFDPLVFPSSDNALGVISRDDIWVET